jgi:radical SAM superfamily enzyme YgiQ (UPF0313 family)
MTETFRLPQMALAVLAAMTPSGIDISITDELVEPISFDAEVDLVGITVNTKTARRAYEIADLFRSRAVPVVLGGIHPKMAPDEAIQHANSIVLGEAEGIWTQLLEDFRSGSLRTVYRNDVPPGLEDSPRPKRDLFQANKYDTLNLIQTSRGCPYSCDFCAVSAFYGDKVRLRSVDNVIAEINCLHGDDLFLVDDNIVGKMGHAQQLLTELVPLKKRWVGQAAVTVANNKQILKLLYRSGCQGLCVGFETTSARGLKEVSKIQNLNSDYIDCIRKLHDNGISILGSFIVGFDTDDKSCFENILEFALKSKIDVVDVYLLAPYPGTPVYKKMKREKRLMDDNWWLKYNDNDVVFRPKLLTREELYEGWVWTMRELYKLSPILQRYLVGVGRRSLFSNILNFKVNMSFRAKAYAMPLGAIIN